MGRVVETTKELLGALYRISERRRSGPCPISFTQKTVKLCHILKSRGHTVIHYGHEDSQVDCTEHVTVVRRHDLDKSYGDHDWRTSACPNYNVSDHAYKIFYARTIAAVFERKKPHDFLLCGFGNNHKPVADAHSDMIICEPGIGYSGGGFAKFRVFESYSAMHVYLGHDSLRTVNEKMWYDVVIPNSYDPADFEFSAQKEDYFLFMGRVNAGKGIHIALQVVEALHGKLVIAGQGAIGENRTRTSRDIAEYTEHVGVVGPQHRSRLMSKAKAILAPSCYLEPFCGVHVEALMCGTPAITTDWGAFTEYNLHGLTGYRCRTFEQFIWAARNIQAIDPFYCRSWAERNFSMDRIGDMYEEYFRAVYNIYAGDGWYELHPERSELAWLNRYYPDPR